MKQLFYSLVAFAFIFSGINSFAQETKVKKKDDKVKIKSESADGTEVKVKVEGPGAGNIMYPYTAEYSSQFVPGNPQHAKLILDMWKLWDDNQIDMQNDWIADTILLQLPDGQVISGKDNFMKESKTYRNMFSTMKSSVETWIPLRSVDRNENWVAIWGREAATNNTGVTTTNMIHEIWRINKDGKIDFMRQYMAKPTAQ
ncbi:MAG: hypothetical protein H0V91_00960 [Flavisolibacter sp.]|jgi:hypothetical protein|nr:hypothetical protein [Flavisolibacter sp.]